MKPDFFGVPGPGFLDPVPTFRISCLLVVCRVSELYLAYAPGSGVRGICKRKEARDLTAHVELIASGEGRFEFRAFDCGTSDVYDTDYFRMATCKGRHGSMPLNPIVLSQDPRSKAPTRIS